MKKYIALCLFVLSITLPTKAQYLFTRQEHAWLKATIERSVALNHNIESFITVQIPIRKQYLTDPLDANIDFADSAEYRTRRGAPSYQSNVGCKAYALDDNWLIAGAVCLWNGRHSVYRDGKIYKTGLVTEDSSRKLLVGGISVPLEGHLFVQPRFTLLPHFILVRVPQDSFLKFVVQSMPKINILGLTHTNPLNLKNGTFFVNTSRFDWNVARPRRLNSFARATKKTTVTIHESFDNLATLSNDPLFYVSNDELYWIGTNEGVMVSYPNGEFNKHSSKDFITFNNSDLDFIKRVITEQDPAAWPRISKRLYRDTVNNPANEGNY